MKTFKQFVTEGTMPVEIRGEQLPLLSALPKTHDMLVKFLEIVNPALKAGEILNPRFIDAKYWLGHINEAMGNKIGADHFNAGKYASVPEKIRDIDLTLGAPGHIAGKVKKLEKISDNHPAKSDYIAYAKEMAILVGAMEALKSHVVKRVTKSPEELEAARKTQFHQKLASVPALKIVNEVLTKMTDEVKHQYAKDVADHYQKMAERFVSVIQHEEKFQKKNEGGAWGENYKYAQSVMMAYGEVIRLCMTSELTPWTPDNRNQITVYTMNADYKAACERTGKEAAEFMQREFLYKNVAKMVNILEEKGNLQGDPKILSIHASGGVIQGDIRFEFADGSGFKVRNKIVLKYSIYGKPFNQFPTTFHDVVLPGGKAMSTPSEERMITVFAKAKAE